MVIAGAIFFYQTNAKIPELPFLPQQSTLKTIKINDTTLKVEIADTKEKRSKGLAGRQSLAPDEGMLFLFPEAGRYPFWMKGLTFPLDFIWIREDKVVDLTQNVPPSSPGQTDASLPIYEPKEDVDAVLEISAGTIQRLNIKVGDSVKIL